MCGRGCLFDADPHTAQVRSRRSRYVISIFLFLCLLSVSAPADARSIALLRDICPMVSIRLIRVAHMVQAFVPVFGCEFLWSFDTWMYALLQ